MSIAASALPRPASSAFRDLVLPKEHGSWSLALEPLALGLIAAPSIAGGFFALGVVAAFFARRPLRIAFRDTRPERQTAARFALMQCLLVALFGTCAAVALAGLDWLLWLAPSALAGAAFLSFDLRSAGREEAAEAAGAAAFAFLPAAVALLGGATPLAAAALALVMCGRAVPTVLSVRSALRAAKTGVRQPALALAASFAALAIGIALHVRQLVPCAAVLALAVFALRATALLVYPRPALRARTIGMIETALGLAFVVAVAATWPSP